MATHLKLAFVILVVPFAFCWTSKVCSALSRAVAEQLGQMGVGGV